MEQVRHLLEEKHRGEEELSSCVKTIEEREEEIKRLQSLMSDSSTQANDLEKGNEQLLASNAVILKECEALVKLFESQLNDANKKIAELGAQLDEEHARAADADKKHQVNADIIIFEVLG